MICELCPKVRNRIPIEDPPCGDARSFAELRMFYPEVARRIARLTPILRAGQGEAHHRGITAEATQPAIERALKEARTGPPACKLTQTQMGIQALLLREVGSGEQVTNVIEELDLMARDHRAAYAEYIARHMPAMEPFLWNRRGKTWAKVCVGEDTQQQK